VDRKWWIQLKSGEAYCDCYGNVIYFDSLEEAEELFEELIDVDEIVRQS
jgi:hypothetical protein